MMADLKMKFARRTEPKRWKDDLGNSYTSWGDVVVTCSEHGEVFRILSASYLEETYPEANNTARLAKEAHLRDKHTS